MNFFFRSFTAIIKVYSDIQCFKPATILNDRNFFMYGHWDFSLQIGTSPYLFIAKSHDYSLN